MKSGLMEIGQVFAVNKSDLPGSDAALAHINSLIALAGNLKWKPPALKVIAKDEIGISELVDAIDKHQAFIRQQDNWSDYRYSMAKKQVESIVKSMTCKPEVLSETTILSELK